MILSPQVVTSGMAIGDPISGVTNNTILYADGSGNLQSNALYGLNDVTGRMTINTSSVITSALTIVPLVSTDTLLWLQGAASQSGNAIFYEDSAGTDIWRLSSTGVINPESLTTWETFNDLRSFSTKPSGRGSFTLAPTLTWTSIPSGILPKSSAQFGISDQRTITSTTNDSDNVFSMEFNPGRTNAYNDVGVTSAAASAGQRNFFAISGAVQDNAGQSSGGAAGYMPKNNPTVNRKMNITNGVFRLTYTQNYCVNTDDTLLYDMAVINTTVSGTPQFFGAGTFRQNNYVVKGTLTGNTVGDSVGIGAYVKVSGYDTNYGYVHSGSGSNYMGFDNSKTLFGGTAFVIATTSAAHSITGNYGSIYYDATNFIINASEVGTGKICLATATYIGAATTPTAILHLIAGTTAASTAPLKFTSGTNMTTAEAGALEFTTDDFFATITTGAARKAFILDDGARLTSGRVPFATTNGRLIDDSDMTFATDTLTVTKIAATTLTGLLTFSDTINIAFNGTTGTKIGTATSQKIGLWNTAPIVQPTTAVAAATFVANTSGIVDDSATFDGYTIGQIVKLLRNIGIAA